MRKLKIAVLMIGALVASAMIAQEVVVRDRSGNTATVTANRLDVNTDSAVADDIAAMAADIEEIKDNTGSTTPVAVAGIARAFGANPTAGAAGANMQPVTDRQGVLRTLGGPANPITLSADFTGTSDDAALVSVSAGTKIGVTRALFSCGAENTGSIAFTLGFGAANTPLSGAGVLLRTTGTTANALSGLGGGSADGVAGIGADGEDLRYDSGDPSGTCTIVVTYYTIES